MSESAYAKEIREVLERFETNESSDDNKVWTLYDYQTSKVCSLPHGTAATVLGRLFDLQTARGYTQEGEPLYYIGEKIGSTRSLRIDFSGNLKSTVEESTIFKLIISAIVMTFDDMFERTSSRKETRICTILLSSDQSYSLDFTILFPFCRMRTDDFERYMVQLEKTMDEKFSDNIYEAFDGVTSFSDILQRTTFADVYPLFGCARSEEDYVKDKYQVWVVDQIPANIDDIPSASISFSPSTNTS